MRYDVKVSQNEATDLGPTLEAGGVVGAGTSSSGEEYFVVRRILDDTPFKPEDEKKTGSDIYIYRTK